MLRRTYESARHSIAKTPDSSSLQMSKTGRRSGGSTRYDRLLRLQQTCGNRAVQKLLSNARVHVDSKASPSFGLPGAVPRNKSLPKMIQRQTDASVESGTGVDSAISSGTMKTDSGIHGKTFVANGCLGKPKCEIKFKFEKAYKGDYSYKAAGGKTVRGVYVKISATTDKKECGESKSLKVVQTIMNFKKGATDKKEERDPGNATRRTRSGWGNAKAPSKGWRVDAGTAETDPFYSSSWVGQEGSDAKPAIIWDTPGYWDTDKNAGKEFRTCAISYNASGKGVTLGCVSWEFYTDSKGDVSFNSTPVASCGASREVKDAVDRWEGIAGNKAVNLGVIKSTNTPKVWLVSNPSKYKETILEKLPKNSRVLVIGEGKGESFNKTVDKYKWWEVKVMDGSTEGRQGWVMQTLLNDATS